MKETIMSDEQEKDELLPCPLCGGEVFIEETTSYYNEMYGNRKFWGVVCRNTRSPTGSCGISIRPRASKEAAKETWNTRRPAPVGVDEREAFEKWFHSRREGSGYGDFQDCSVKQYTWEAWQASRSLPQAPASEEDLQQLMKFYQADNLVDLVRKQSNHVTRLQAKLPALIDEFPGNYRQG